MKISKELLKGSTATMILKVISEGDSYGYEITQKIAARSKEVFKLNEGTLYPILTRQKNQGLLTYRWEESPQGPPRKYYSLSEEGRRTLAQLDESWEELVEQVRAIRHGDRNITAVEPIE